jgi:hypothetical protein
MSPEDEDEGEEEEFVELDLDKTLTWTGNAVSIQPGGEFRLPLIVAHPSVLAIQFEVEGGYDIEFSLVFHDDHEQEAGASVLVEPVRVADREGQLDIDTTGVCELLWSNQHAWMSSKVLSYQLQLAPKVNTQMRKFRAAVISAADDYRVLAAAEAADEVDRNMRTLKQRTAQLQQELSSGKEKAAAAAARHERYLGHVKKLEEEVAAAKAHAEQAKADLAATHREASGLERRLVQMQSIRTLDDGIDAALLRTLQAADEPLELLFEAYAGAMYPQEEPPEEEGEEGGASSELKIDRAEMIHLLQDFDVMSRGPPPETMCGVFVGCAQSLSPTEFKRCIARAALALAPSDAPPEGLPLDTSDQKLRWLLRQLPTQIDSTKLPVLDVQRRVRVLAAAEHLAALLDIP